MCFKLQHTFSHTTRLLLKKCLQQLLRTSFPRTLCFADWRSRGSILWSTDFLSCGCYVSSLLNTLFCGTLRCADEQTSVFRIGIMRKMSRTALRSRCRCTIKIKLMRQVRFFAVIYCTLKHFPQTSSGKSSLEYIHTMMGAHGGPSSKDTIIIIIIKSVIDTIVILTIRITVTSNITSQ